MTKTTTISVSASLRDHIKALGPFVAAHYNQPGKRPTLSQTIELLCDAFNELTAQRPPEPRKLMGSKASQVVRLLGYDWSYEHGHGKTCFQYAGYPMWVCDDVLSTNEAETIAMLLGPLHGVNELRG